MPYRSTSFPRISIDNRWCCLTFLDQKKTVQIFPKVAALRISVPVEPHQIHVSIDSNVNDQLQSWYWTLMLKLMIKCIFYIFLVYSWYFPFMKLTLYCQTVVRISDPLHTAVVDIHRFSANFFIFRWHLKNSIYLLKSEKFDVFTYLRFKPRLFSVKQCCLIISRSVIVIGAINHLAKLQSLCRQRLVDNDYIPALFVLNLYNLLDLVQFYVELLGSEQLYVEKCYMK